MPGLLVQWLVSFASKNSTTVAPCPLQGSGTQDRREKRPTRNMNNDLPLRINCVWRDAFLLFAYGPPCKSCGLGQGTLRAHAEGSQHLWLRSSKKARSMARLVVQRACLTECHTISCPNFNSCHVQCLRRRFPHVEPLSPRGERIDLPHVSSGPPEGPCLASTPQPPLQAEARQLQRRKVPAPLQKTLFQGSLPHSFQGSFFLETTKNSGKIAGLLKRWLKRMDKDSAPRLAKESLRSRIT